MARSTLDDRKKQAGKNVKKIYKRRAALTDKNQVLSVRSKQVDTFQRPLQNVYAGTAGLT